jgi:hypothetical protein
MSWRERDRIVQRTLAETKERDAHRKFLRASLRWGIINWREVVQLLAIAATPLIICI